MAILPEGTRVRIKPNLRQGGGYARYVNERMADIAGETRTIGYYIGNNHGKATYRLTGERWEWSEDMFDVVLHFKSQEDAFAALVRGEITSDVYENVLKEVR